MAWSRLPNAWIYDGGLRRFSTAPKDRGRSSAALKVLLALIVRAENKSLSEAGHNQGSVSSSYDDLMSLTNLSRAQIAKAVKLLTELQLVTVTRAGRGGRNRYFISNYGPHDRYGKVPNRRIYGTADPGRIRVLHEFSCRNESDVNALKLYFLMCGLRDSSGNRTLASYVTIETKTGVAQAKIRRALSVLIEHGLIRVDQQKDTDQRRNLPNRYEVLGLVTAE